MVTSIAILGTFENWKYIEQSCEKSTHDKKGVAVGIITRKIETDFGTFSVKFLLMYIDETLLHRLKPTYKFTYQEILNEGFENVLARIGRKVVLNVRLKEERVSKEPSVNY